MTFELEIDAEGPREPLGLRGTQGQSQPKKGGRSLLRWMSGRVVAKLSFSAFLVCCTLFHTIPSSCSFGASADEIRGLAWTAATAGADRAPAADSASSPEPAWDVLSSFRMVSSGHPSDISSKAADASGTSDSVGGGEEVVGKATYPRSSPYYRREHRRLLPSDPLPVPFQGIRDLDDEGSGPTNIKINVNGVSSSVDIKIDDGDVAVGGIHVGINVGSHRFDSEVDRDDVSAGHGGRGSEHATCDFLEGQPQDGVNELFPRYHLEARRALAVAEKARARALKEASEMNLKNIAYSKEDRQIDDLDLPTVAITAEEDIRMIRPLASKSDGGISVQVEAGNTPHYVGLFSQKLDHFDFSSDKTFPMRFMLNCDFWGGPGYPILFYAGNEGDIKLFWNNSGFVTNDLAQELRAAVVFMEHRYFGHSLPFSCIGSASDGISCNGDHSGDHDVEDKNKFLSVEQALQDYAVFISSSQTHVLRHGDLYGCRRCRMGFRTGAAGETCPGIEPLERMECPPSGPARRAKSVDDSPSASGSAGGIWTWIKRLLGWGDDPSGHDRSGGDRSGGYRSDDDLSGGYRSVNDLSGCDLSGCDLSGCDLSAGVLRGVDKDEEELIMSGRDGDGYWSIYGGGSEGSMRRESPVEGSGQGVEAESRQPQVVQEAATRVGRGSTGSSHLGEVSIRPEMPVHPLPEMPVHPLPEMPVHPLPEMSVNPLPEMTVHPLPEMPVNPLPEMPAHPQGTQSEGASDWRPGKVTAAVRDSPGCPVIAVGGSYGGMLAAWLRMKYPHLVTAALAASAPLRGYFNENLDFDFFRQVTSVFRDAGEQLDAEARAIRSAITAPSTHTPFVDTPFVDTPFVDTPAADTSFTNTPFTHTPFTLTPFTHTPFADTPFADTPFADTPFADTPFADTPFADTPFADTPFADTPFADTPFADTPFTHLPFTHTQPVAGLDGPEHYDCTDFFRKAFAALSAAALRAGRGDSGGAVQAGKAFHLCPSSQPLEKKSDVLRLIEWLQNALADIAMANYPYPADFLFNSPAWPVKHLCKFVIDNALQSSLFAQSADTATAGEQDLLSPSSSFTSATSSFRLGRTTFRRLTDPTAEEINMWEVFRKGLSSVGILPPSKCLDLNIASDGKLGADMFGYLACTSQILPTDTNGKTDMFPPSRAEVQDIVQSCNEKWHAQPDFSWIHSFTGVELSFCSGIIFSNGALDPWMLEGVTQQPSEGCPSIMIEQGAHHLDLRMPHLLDPMSVVLARGFEVKQLRKWVEEWRRSHGLSQGSYSGDSDDCDDCYHSDDEDHVIGDDGDDERSRDSGPAWIGEDNSAQEYRRPHPDPFDLEVRGGSEVVGDVKSEADAGVKSEADAGVKSEADAGVKSEADAGVKSEADAGVKSEADAGVKSEADAGVKSEEDAKVKSEEDAKVKSEEDAKVKSEENAKVKSEENAKVKSEENADGKSEKDGDRQDNARHSNREEVDGDTEGVSSEMLVAKEEM